jgi:predicted metal-dependent phosphoesterase TrpH
LILKQHRASSLITELHCHTQASDGTLTPSELVELASKRDIKVLAITDHDTVTAHAEAARACVQHHLQFIRGIEISSLADNLREVHVLGYGVEPTDQKTTDRIHALRDARDGRAKAMVVKLHALGIAVSYDRIKELAGDAMVGRPHVVKALLEGHWVTTRQEAFDIYLAEGKPAFVPHQGLTPAEAIELIHRTHGIAVVAHPGLYAGDADRLLAELLLNGLDGVEVYYPLHAPEQIKHYAAFAQANGLIATGGSDFHGFVGDTETTLGSIHLPAGTIEAIETRIGQVRAAVAL